MLYDTVHSQKYTYMKNQIKTAAFKFQVTENPLVYMVLL